MQLREAMASRGPVEQAEVILMTAHGIDGIAVRAAAHRAQHSNTRLHEVTEASRQGAHRPLTGQP